MEEDKERKNGENSGTSKVTTIYSASSWSPPWLHRLLVTQEPPQVMVEGRDQRKVQEIKDASKRLGDKDTINEKRERNEASVEGLEEKKPADKRRLKEGRTSEGHLSVGD